MQGRMWAVAIILAAAGGCAAEPPAGTDAFIESYFTAFNAHDVAQMRTHWTEDIEWVALDENGYTVLISSADALEDAMADYFADHPDVRSEAGPLVRSDNVLAFRETAMWTGADGPRSQEALAVYELEDGRIARFVYFGEPE